MDNKIKVLVWGDLVTPTGFSRVNHSIFENLKDRLDLVGLGVNYRGDPNTIGFPVFPANLAGDIYGVNRIKEFVQDNLDVIFILNDAWVIDKFLIAIKDAWKEQEKKLPKIVCYVPVDAEEHFGGWYEHFDIVSKVVAYTEYGKEVILKAAPELKDKITIVAHGTDTKTFFPVDRTLARHKVFNSTKADKDFIFLNANRNQPRKKLDVTLEAFKIFSEGKDNVRLYMHCGVQDMHMDIARLAVRLGIDSKLVLTSLIRGVQQVPNEQLNYIYNSCDVGLNTGLGEGWGLTSVEHASTGAPQIVPDHSACREIFKDCGVLTPTSGRWVFDNIMTVGRIVTPEDVAQDMQTLYSQKDVYDRISKAALAKFTSEEFTWEYISNIWFKIFEELHNDTGLAFKDGKG